MTESLPESEAHLWIVRPDAVRDSALLARYRSLLTGDEARKCGRFRFEKDRHVCLVTRALLRTTLSRYADVPPERWRFVTNEYGCPSIDEPHDLRSLRFNLSHTNGLVVCLVARGRDVGVDVEDRTRGGSLLEVADRFFSPLEVSSLRRLPAEQQLDRFFLYWTLKESYIKARGMGLAIPLGQFSFDLDLDLDFDLDFEGGGGGARSRERGIQARFDPRLEDDPERWQFTVLSYGRRHAIASSLRRHGTEELRLRLREVVPPA
jgi:4'-phosphopantetheinyl transferase